MVPTCGIFGFNSRVLAMPEQDLIAVFTGWNMCLETASLDPDVALRPVLETLTGREER